MKQLASIAVLVLLYGASTADAQESKVRIIVTFSGTPDPGVVTGAEGVIVSTLDDAGRVVAADVPVSKVAQIQANPKVQYAEVDGNVELYIIGPPVVVGGKWLPQSIPWGVAKIGAPQVWGVSTGVGVRVAVIDTGIAASHPDLLSRVVLGPNFVGGPSMQASSMDDNGHGTHVAGIIGASNNKVGVVGVAPGCSLYAVKVMDKMGNGHKSTLVKGIYHASDPKQGAARVINLSVGLPSGKSVREACDQAVYERGVVVCAAASNFGPTVPIYPAAYESVIAVANTDKNDQIYAVNYSGLFGFPIPLPKNVIKAIQNSAADYVDVTAPGVEIVSTWPGGAYARATGTSMATPHVSGLAALLIASDLVSDRSTDSFSKYLQKVNQLVASGTSDISSLLSVPGFFINDEVRARIEQTATLYPSHSPKFGYGRIDAAAAIMRGRN